MKGKGHIILNGWKGIFTLEEVCNLLRKNKIDFKIVTSKARSNKELRSTSTSLLSTDKTKEV